MRLLSQDLVRMRIRDARLAGAHDGAPLPRTEAATGAINQGRGSAGLSML
jgi:hypothetical protein